MDIIDIFQNFGTSAATIGITLWFINKRVGEIEDKLDDFHKEFVSKELLAEKMGNIDYRLTDLKCDINNIGQKVRNMEDS